MRSTFQTEQWLPYPLEAVFAFFADPANLPRLMPKWQAARIDEAGLCPPPPHPDGTRDPAIAAGDGSRLLLSFRPFPGSPVRVSWQAEIADFVWNEQFCDTQTRGPFRFWHHCHKVSAVDGGTLLRDEVKFELPFEPLSRLALPLLRRQMAAMFHFRQQQTVELLALASPKVCMVGREP